MRRILPTLAVLLLSTAGLAACASDEPITKVEDAAPAAEKPAAAEPAAAEDEDEDAPTAGAADSVIPAGARAASDHFPFPVPEDWPELRAFAEDKIGKDIGMSGSVGFPGDAKSAADTYRALLEKAGFAVHPHPLGEQVHDAAFVVKGSVDGIAYSGTVNFDTDSEGTQRVAIDLTED